MIIERSSAEGSIEYSLSISGADNNTDADRYAVELQIQDVVVSATASVPADTWISLVASISQGRQVMYVGGTMVTEAAEQLPTARTTPAMLHVGAGFLGDVDNVRIDRGIWDPTSVADKARCPSADGTGVIADIRFNEQSGHFASITSSSPSSLPVDMSLTAGAGTLEAANAAYTDLVAAYGVVGRISGMAAAGEAVTLACPSSDSGQSAAISEFLLVDYGTGVLDSGGSFSPADCSAAEAALSVVAPCKGQSSCTVELSDSTFAAHPGLSACSHQSSALSVVAVCAPVSDAPGTDSRWADSSAPSDLGVLNSSLASITCPSAVEAAVPDGLLPDSMLDRFPGCTAFDIGAAVATLPHYFAVSVFDKCGVDQLWPSINGDASLRVSWTWDEAAGASALERDACSVGAELSEVIEPIVLGDTTNGDSACSDLDETHLFQFSPQAVGGGRLSVRLDGSVVTQPLVSTTPGPPSARFSDITGSAVLAPVLGRPMSLVFLARDAGGNPLDSPCTTFSDRLSLEFSPAVDMVAVEDREDGVCEFEIMFSSSGRYMLNVTAETTDINLAAVRGGLSSVDTVVLDVVVAATSLLPAQAATGVWPEGRASTGAAQCGSTLFLYGGANPARSYLDDTWKLQVSDDIAGLVGYQTPVHVTAGDAPGAFTEALPLDTAALIAAGQLRHDCTDMMFVTQSGALLDFWLDPVPGCNSESSVIWLRVLSGEDVIMLHGSPQVCMSTTT